MDPAGWESVRSRSLYTLQAVHVSEVHEPISHRNEHAHQPSFLQGTQHCALLTLTSGLCSTSVSVVNSPSRSTKSPQSVVCVCVGGGGGGRGGEGGQSWGVKGGCVCGEGGGLLVTQSMSQRSSFLRLPANFPFHTNNTRQNFKGHLFII